MTLLLTPNIKAARKVQPNLFMNFWRYGPLRLEMEELSTESFWIITQMLVQRLFRMMYLKICLETHGKCESD